MHTVLAAHAVPPEFAGRADAYVDLVCDEILPALAGRPPADFCDVFCDRGAFTVAQARRVLERARELGYGLKIHAEEIAHTGGARLAAELGCVSADHLEHVTGEDIVALYEAGVVAVLLPGTSYTLRCGYAPARAMLEVGLEIALATDFNPGSCYCENLQTAISLACQEGGLTPDEAIRAATLGGAAAIGRADRARQPRGRQGVRPDRPRQRHPPRAALPLRREPRRRGGHRWPPRHARGRRLRRRTSTTSTIATSTGTTMSSAATAAAAIRVTFTESEGEARP